MGLIYTFIHLDRTIANRSFYSLKNLTKLKTYAAYFQFIKEEKITYEYYCSKLILQIKLMVKQNIHANIHPTTERTKPMFQQEYVLYIKI